MKFNMMQYWDKVPNELEQARFIINYKSILTSTSCPTNGCKTCIVANFTPKNGTCPVDCKIKAAKNILRKYKLERINK